MLSVLIVLVSRSIYIGKQFYQLASFISTHIIIMSGMAALVHCTFVIHDHEVVKSPVTPVHILHIPLLCVMCSR